LWPPDGRLTLPTPFPNITAANLFDGLKREQLQWAFNADASQLQLEVPAQAPATLPAIIALETAENTAQFADGRIVFSALDARVQGHHARLESHPGNHRIGFWSEPGDSVTWEFKPTRWGMYDLELAFSAQDGDGTELQIDIAGKTFTVARPSTGSWYRYQTLPIGRFYLSKAEPFAVRVSCLSLKGGAVMNLKAVTLRPAPEGEPIAQDTSGAVTLEAGDATTHGVMMRFEPATNKNCLGYWVNPDDWAEWQFTVGRPATFEIEVSQGCGKGQGGSDVAVQVGGQKFTFGVEETGHFQIFLPRRIGRVHLAKPGVYALAVKPQRKQAGAVMDVRQVRLVPLDPTASASAAARRFLEARRVVFLGDSITYGGEYVDFVEAWIRMRFPDANVEFIDLGLPSETVCGLSEPGHAGGAFPRPDLHERLGRVLEKATPDLIVACYGMNDGIYHPFNDERFQRFQDGIRPVRDRAAAGRDEAHIHARDGPGPSGRRAHGQRARCRRGRPDRPERPGSRALIARRRDDQRAEAGSGAHGLGLRGVVESRVR